MPTTQVFNTRIAGIQCVVPQGFEDIEIDAARYGREEAEKLTANTGVRRRPVVDPSVCTSDLCAAAARNLLDQLHWDPATIGGLIFVSQTPDYLLPATSCTLQHRLGLPTTCAAFDVNLGCSGYPYGLWLANTLAAGGLGRVLLLVGDTSSRVCRPEDRSTRPLFGDAGTATAIECTEGPSRSVFSMGTDGGGARNLIVSQGMFRNQRSYSDARLAAKDAPLFMDGAEIFSFTLERVPSLIKGALAAAQWDIASTHAFVFHQANKFILNHLAKRMKIPVDKVPLSIEDFGNTSSATIPITIAAKLQQRVSEGPTNLLMAGFGVGYSWGAAAMAVGPIPAPSIQCLLRS